MSAKSKKTSFLTAQNQINKISERDLLEALKKVEANNLDIRKSFRSDTEAMSYKARR